MTYIPHSDATFFFTQQKKDFTFGLRLDKAEVTFVRFMYIYVVQIRIDDARYFQHIKGLFYK